VSPSNVDEEGTPADAQSAFEVTSDVQISRYERFKIFVDETFFASARILRNDYRALIGTGILLVYLFVGLIGVRIVEIPRASDGPLLFQPFDKALTHHPFGIPEFSIGPWTYIGIWRFPLGTDQVGKGIFAGLVHSTPVVLKMMLAGAVFSTVMATIWGITAGYKGGRWDRVMMTISDVVMTIPGLPLVVVLAEFINPENPYVVGLLLAVPDWAGLSRSLRSQVLTLREESYVEASRIMGVKNRTIMRKDILPNVVPYIMVHFVTGARGIIFQAIGLYFLGVLPFSTVNWGVMMNLAYQDGALFDPAKYHWFVAPTVTVLVLSLGLILFGQGMDRIFNPRIRARHAKSTPDDGEEEV